MLSLNLKNKNILITGATSGIGQATALYLSKCGANVIMLARDRGKLEKLNKQIANSIIYSIDLNRIDKIYEIFEYLYEQHIKLDGLVHCAGIAPLMRIDENDIESMKEVFNINYFSFIEMVKYMGSVRYANDGGSIIAVSSITAIKGNYRQGVYAGSKAALNTTIKSMAKELLNRNIRVNSIIAGVVETELVEKLRLETVDFDEKIRNSQPLGIIEKEYVSYMIGYLLSDFSKYLTGTLMPLDGGALL